MRGQAPWTAVVFLAAVIMVVCTALSGTSPSSAENHASDVGTEEQPAAEPLGESGHPGGRDTPEVSPPVVVLPPAPSVYESVPRESLTNWVARVGGDPISVRLFERRLARNRFSAFQHFGQKHGASPGADFWSTSHEGQVPAEWLKKRTLEECVRIKIELGLAKENGVIGDTSYAAFLKALDKENQRRREALAKGEPIYGPQQYGEDQFFLYVMNNMRIALQRTLWQGRLHASEETLREHYESTKGERYDRGYGVKIWAIEVHYGKRSGYEEWLTRDAAKAKMEEVKQRLDAGERFEDLAAEYNENGELNEDVFDFESRLADKSHRASTREEAMSLSEGETSDVFEDMSAFFILKCVGKEALGCQPYEEVKGSVQRHYVQEKYQALVAELVKAAVVEIDRQEWDRMRMSRPHDTATTGVISSSETTESPQAASS